MADTGNDNLDEIIHGCLRKKEKSQEMLYKRFFGYALRVALIHNRNHDNALEIVNDSFVKVFKQFDSYNISLPFKNWLSKIVINTSIDKFRRDNRSIQFEKEEPFLVPDDSPNVVTQLTVQDILMLMNRLPDNQRFGFRFIFPGSISNKNAFNQQVISNLTIPSKKDTLNDQILIRQVPAIQAKDNTNYRISHAQALQPKNEPQNKIHATRQIQDTTDILSIAEVNASESNPIINPSEKTITDQSPDAVNPGLQSPDVNVEDVSNLSEVNKPDTSINNAYRKLAEVNATPEKSPSDSRRSQKIRIGVNISPGITSTNTGSSFTYSGGINADFEFYRNLRLSSGIQIERQHVVYESPSNPGWIPPGNTESELVDLDVPINITWKFLIKKSTCYYLSGGISSIVYLSEKYTNTSYTQKMVQATEMVDGVPNVVYQLENVKSVEQTTEAPLSTFDFAGRINITFGIEQPLFSKLTLYFEPFIKIPVSDLATQNLRFSSSGIMCKISF